MGKAYADRGKRAEKEVQEFLSEVNSRVAEFDFSRLPDARAAMGRMKAMPADFEFFAPGVHGLIEAKETEHDYLLHPSKVPQLARLKKRILAGGRCLVIVLHTSSHTWRLLNAADMPTRVSGSWRLNELPHVLGKNLAEVLKQTYLTQPGHFDLTFDTK